MGRSQERLTTSRSYWFPPHGRTAGLTSSPVLGVFVDGVVYTTSHPERRKARNLASNQHCAATASTDGIDLVVEGIEAKVEDKATLQRVFDAYRSKYAFWRITLRDDAFDAPDGAPTAGAPPYQPYAVTPTRIHGFGTDKRFAPLSTRWEFQ